MTSYSHLHVHSTFSILDSIIKIPELVSYIKELGMTSVALTDHGSMFGVIDFYKECKDNDIHPIIGIEAYCTEDEDNAEERTRDNYHLVLLAKNQTGLENLTWLTSNSYLNNFYYKPRIYRPLLEEHSEGVIALSACLASYCARKLRWESSISKMFIDDYKGYMEMLGWFCETFRDDFYLEIQDHDFWEQEEYNRILVDIAHKEKIPLVITSDAHYLRREDTSTHELMMAMQLKMKLEDYRAGDQMKYGATNYIKSSQEMLDSARKYNAEEAFYNTNKIAEMCKVEIEFGNPKMPVFDCSKAEDYQEFLRYLKEK